MTVALLIFLSCPLSTLEMANEMGGDSSSRTLNKAAGRGRMWPFWRAYWVNTELLSDLRLLIPQGQPA